MEGASLLPRVESRRHYFELFPDDTLWGPAVEEIRRRHRLPRPLERSRPGSNIVYRAGGQTWIKLCAPLFAEEMVVEGRVLPAVERLPVPVPRVLDRGEIEGWPYLILSHVHGSAIGDFWHRWDPERQRQAARAIGPLIRRMHEIPLDGVGPLPSRLRPHLAPPWDPVIEHHRRTGLGEAWLAAIPSFLDASLAGDPGRDEPPVLLHADLTADHLMVVSEDDPAIRGVIDFADAFVGPRAYELCAPVVHLLLRRADLLAAFLDGYGEARSPESLLAWWILHAFANLPRLIARDLEAVSPGDLAALAHRVFPMGA